MSAKLNDVDPQAWLADVLARIADTPITRLEQLLPEELAANEVPTTSGCLTCGPGRMVYERTWLTAVATAVISHSL
ncbi:hypothetical protein J2Z31_005415 [Sinorhizobium kostiense]|uniref:Transposase IS66 C-terminal domain-containing protein n=1 Tax=Sinorhizobium kostiense TaxID=76747 RepID=A0ABS4R982_9HYPH|nr:hypothetical protein [Sinorhizobium kostiense]